MHFTTQGGFLTDIPFIYHPHDLQHRHLPHFFTPRKRATREYQYSTLCQHASIVCVVSEWGKQDLLGSFNLPESKVHIVNFAPDPTVCSRTDPNTVKATRLKLSLPERFILYPARTWPHKNHRRLFQALKILRDQDGLTIPLVCSGEPTEFYANLKAEAEALDISEQVSFVGFVELNELRALYELCVAVVIPTLFEAGSFPLWEAFLSQRPAACSNVTSLPAQAGDAALVFDPYKEEEIAGAVKRLWTESDLRSTLVQRGTSNVSRYSWDTTARTFRALYRRLGNRQLTPEDQRLLSAAPLM
jgi:glycosyltransferase involved in cell wall biosynthesis